MTIEIVDFPIDSMVIFHSYVAVYQICNRWEQKSFRLLNGLVEGKIETGNPRVFTIKLVGFSG